MHLSPQEKDKLLIVTAALLAERRLNRGLQLNHPEAVAWLSFLVMEGARDGKSVAELMQEGTTWLQRDQVMEGVPELVVKGGSIVWAQMGDANASIPTPGPVHGRPMFGAFGKALAPSCITFVSEAALDADIQRQLGLERPCMAVKDTRSVGKSALKLNSALPSVSVDPQTYEVFADSELLTCEPAEVLPLAQRYLLL